MKKNRIESIKEFGFTLTRYDSGRVVVVMNTWGVDMDDLAMATKYMMWICSNKSEVSFDATMEFLIKGAATFEGVGLKVLPGKSEKPNDHNAP